MKKHPIHHPPQKKVRKNHHANTPLRFTLSLLLTIGIIALLFQSGNIIGKAFQSTQGSEIDLRLQENNFLLDITPDIVGANNREITGIYFEVQSATEGFSICDVPEDITVSTWIDNWEYRYADCENNRFIFGTATVQNGIFSNSLQQAISFTTTHPLPADFSLQVNSVDLFAANYGEDLFPDEQDDTTFNYRIEAPATVVQPQESSSPSGGAPSSGGGGGGSSSFFCKREWSCEKWSSCQNGQQTRVCKDLKDCQPSKTVGSRVYPVYISGLKMPETVKDCISTKKIMEVPLPVVEQPKPMKPILQVPLPVEQKDYSLWILLGLILVVVLCILLMIWLHYHHKKAVYNVDELRHWIEQERRAGSKDEDIRQILQEKTHWSREEMDNVLR